MAVVVTEFPVGTKFLSDCMNMDLRLDTVSDDVTTRTLEYQLWCRGANGDTPLQSVQNYEPCDINDNIFFTIASLVECALSCPPPTLEGTGVIDGNDDFKKEIYLRYREVSILKEDCSVTQPAWEETAPFTVVNASFQVYQDRIQPPMALTQSKVIPICRGNYDWIRVCGTQQVTLRGLDHANNVTAEEIVTINDGQILSTGPANISIDISDVCKYQVSFPSGQAVTYVIQNCCCDDENSLAVYFKESLGSWGVMSFDCIDSEIISRDIVSICNAGICSQNPYDLISKYGRSIVNKRKWMTVSLSMEFPDRSFKEFVHAFANADAFYAPYRCADPGKAKFLAPLIPTTTSIQTKTKDGVTRVSFSALYGNDLA